MTVAELIAKLQQLDQDAQIFVASNVDGEEMMSDFLDVGTFQETIDCYIEMYADEPEEMPQFNIPGNTPIIFIAEPGIDWKKVG